MTYSQILLPPGTLWKKLQETTHHALQCGALIPISTKSEFVEQDGVIFLVRVLSNLNRKQSAQKKQDQIIKVSGTDFNPFLPYQEDLFVADISETHVCILNKFNVVNYHLLIITRAFVEQESLLTGEDLAAMWACLAEFDGLAFYNGGKVAGASQRHKHLQIIPLAETEIPIAPLLTTAKLENGITTIPAFPFLHAFTAFSPDETPQDILSKYYALLDMVSITATDDLQQSAAYNFLATRNWMLVVPRLKEDFISIPINSLGFAGSLLVKNSAQMQLVKDIGPMNILKNVAISNI
ncbi:phosphorylase [Cylindrospermopsis raciborskii CHAB3438]|uniref:ATP adenylyltransferase family protein n=1 Tax=Cylindrospermopsis raciborskii TaxID=77022 RepID=UPI001F0EC0AF|nr:phosphorylase [Cylindrospermopsis raciborskii]MCH4904265.1 phosphorylase [Cylindrospermopsis raciborskii CHAB3438]